MFVHDLSLKFGQPYTLYQRSYHTEVQYQVQIPTVQAWTVYRPSEMGNKQSSEARNLDEDEARGPMSSFRASSFLSTSLTDKTSVPNQDGGLSWISGGPLTASFTSKQRQVANAQATLRSDSSAMRERQAREEDVSMTRGKRIQNQIFPKSTSGRIQQAAVSGIVSEEFPGVDARCSEDSSSFRIPKPNAFSSPSRRHRVKPTFIDAVTTLGPQDESGVPPAPLEVAEDVDGNGGRGVGGNSSNPGPRGGGISEGFIRAFGRAAAKSLAKLERKGTKIIHRWVAAAQPAKGILKQSKDSVLQSKREPETSTGGQVAAVAPAVEGVPGGAQEKDTMNNTPAARSEISEAFLFEVRVAGR